MIPSSREHLDRVEVGLGPLDRHVARCRRRDRRSAARAARRRRARGTARRRSARRRCCTACRPVGRARVGEMPCIEASGTPPVTPKPLSLPTISPKTAVPCSSAKLRVLRDSRSCRGRWRRGRAAGPRGWRSSSTRGRRSARRRRACAGPAGEVVVDALRRRPQVALHRGELRRRRWSAAAERRPARRRRSSPRQREQLARAASASTPAGSSTRCHALHLRRAAPGAGAGLGGERGEVDARDHGSRRPAPGAVEHVVHGRRRRASLTSSVDLRLDRRDRCRRRRRAAWSRRAARPRGSAPACRSARRRGRRPDRARGRHAGDRGRRRSPVIGTSPGDARLTSAWSAAPALRIRQVHRARCRDGSLHEVPSPVSDVHSGLSHRWPRATSARRRKAAADACDECQIRSGLEPSAPLAPSSRAPTLRRPHDEPDCSRAESRSPTSSGGPSAPERMLDTHDGSARGRPGRVALFRSLTTE